MPPVGDPPTEDTCPADHATEQSRFDYLGQDRLETTKVLKSIGRWFKIVSTKTKSNQTNKVTPNANKNRTDSVLQIQVFCVSI